MCSELLLHFVLFCIVCIFVAAQHINQDHLQALLISTSHVTLSFCVLQVIRPRNTVSAPGEEYGSHTMRHHYPHANKRDNVPSLQIQQTFFPLKGITDASHRSRRNTFPPHVSKHWKTAATVILRLFVWMLTNVTQFLKACWITVCGWTCLLLLSLTDARHQTPNESKSCIC